MILAALILGAAFLRFYHLEWSEFKLDEARLASIALQFVRSGHIPLWGINASIGIPNFPLSAWLLAIPYLFSSSPLVATGFVAGLNVIAVGLVYLLGRSWFGPLPGLVAGILYATSPWAILYSRKIWPPDLLSPFLVIFVFAAGKAYLDVHLSPKQQAFWLAVHGLALAAMIQIQYATLALILPAALWLIVFARRLTRPGLLSFAGVWALAFLPFLALDLRRGGVILHGILGLAGRPASTDLKAVEFAWILMVGGALHSLAGVERFQELLSRIGDIGPVQILIGVWVLLGAAIQVYRLIPAVQARKWTVEAGRAFLLLTWLSAPILAQIRHPLNIQLEYLLTVIPAACLLAGSLLAGKASRWLQVGSLALALAVGGVQGYRIIETMTFVGTETTPGAYGVPLAKHLEAAEAVRSFAGTMPVAEVWVLGLGANPDFDGEPAVYQHLLVNQGPKLPLQFRDPRERLDLPNYSVLLLSLPEIGFRPPMGKRAQAQELAPGIPWRNDEGVAQIWFWNGGAPEVPEHVFIPAVRWIDGVELYGVSIPACFPSGGAVQRLYFYWRLQEESGPFQVFNHLVHEAGEMPLAQADGPGPLPPAGACAGCLYNAISWYDLVGPVQQNGAERLQLLAGRYTLPGATKIPRVDGGGETIPLGAVEIAATCAN